MPRYRPTRKTDVIGAMDLRPEKCIGEYRTSKMHDKNFVKPPNWDSAGESIEMVYIANLREHDAMVALQKQLVAAASRQKEVNCQRTRIMNKMQEKLRKRFIEVNSFIKDCADKKRGAQKIVSNETALHEELRKGIDQFSSDLRELAVFRKHLKATVSEFQPYEKVLLEVVEKSDIFVSPKDCMDRCDALMMAQEEIHKMEQKKLQEMEEMRLRMISITNEAALTVLGLKTDLALLERSYNESRSKSITYQKILEDCKNTISCNEQKKARALEGITVLYMLLCKRRGIHPKRKINVEKKMDFIKYEVELLMDLLKAVDELNEPQKAEKGDKTAGFLC